MQVELTEAAVNCLKFWQGHEFYGGTLSHVIVLQMHEWLMRDKHASTNADIEKELERIKKGKR